MNEVPAHILIVDDDRFVAESLAAFLRSHDFSVSIAQSGEHALDMLREESPPVSVLITDVAMPGMDGLELIRTLRKSQSSVVPIAVTGFGTIEQAVQAIRCGAVDYLTKPIVDEELRIAVEKAVQQHALRSENTTLRERLHSDTDLGSIVGGDARMRDIFDVVHAVASSNTTALMCGESGTGKSMIARAIHQNSSRAGQPFVEISCGSIPETLLESELFGHVKGAFTGAHVDKPGRFRAAHNGTLFLDEINSASPGMQLKLLRVLQERSFEPVGSSTPVEVDVRVILASNEPLEELVAAGTFRQDLFYRINVVQIQLPPLRDRIGDIPQLAEHFLESKSQEVGKQVIGFTDEAMQTLRAYSFPGNVRELENIVERAVVLTQQVRIGIEDLPAHVRDERDHPLTPNGDAAPWSMENYRPMPLREALEEPEKQIILAALEANGWNRQQTADVLDINRTTLYKKIKAYDLERYGEAG